MEPIQIIGIDELRDQEKEIANKIISDSYEKIFKEMQDETKVSVHFKVHHREGKNRQYEILAKAVIPGCSLESTETDWDIGRTLHKVFDNIKRQIEHKCNS